MKLLQATQKRGGEGRRRQRERQRRAAAGQLRSWAASGGSRRAPGRREGSVGGRRRSAEAPQRSCWLRAAGATGLAAAAPHPLDVQRRLLVDVEALLHVDRALEHLPRDVVPDGGRGQSRVGEWRGVSGQVSTSGASTKPTGPRLQADVLPGEGPSPPVPLRTDRESRLSLPLVLVSIAFRFCFTFTCVRTLGSFPSSNIANAFTAMWSPKKTCGVCTRRVC